MTPPDPHTHPLPAWLGPLRCETCQHLDTLRLVDPDATAGPLVTCTACGAEGVLWTAERAALLGRRSTDRLPVLPAKVLPVRRGGRRWYDPPA